MDLNKITTGGKIFAGAGLLYFIFSFFNWYSVDSAYAGILDISATGWNVGFLWCTLWALLFLAGAVLLVLPAFGIAAPKVPAVAFLAVGALATFFTVLRLILGEGDYWSAAFGIYVAVLAAAAATFGGLTLFKESGGDVNDLKDFNKLKSQFTSTGGDTSSAPPPPPPPPPGATPPPPPPPPPAI
jgi:hypothetical protein